MQIGPTKNFEELKQIDENGNEFWSARDMFVALDYSRWEDFKLLLNRAKSACEKSGQFTNDQFRDVPKLITHGKGGQRNVGDINLSRYACYLIAQNGDPMKMESIALAQTYFALQSRRIEVQDLKQLEEDKKRLYVREQVKSENKKLFSTAKQSGVSNFGSFNDAGYWGLYGMPLKEVEKKKQVKKGQLLDQVSSSELSANWFRITQTEERLKIEKPNNQYRANTIHNMAGAEVRETMKRISGVMPENMPVVNHIKEVKKNLKLTSSKKVKKM